MKIFKDVLGLGLAWAFDSQSRLFSAICCAVMLLALTAAVRLRLRRRLKIRNAEGECIPDSAEDTRFTRYTSGRELSDRLYRELGRIYTFAAGDRVEL